MTQSSPETLQRAAILIAALDADLADQLLDQMPSDEAARVRRAIMELGDVDSAQERDVIDAFLAKDTAAVVGARKDLAASAPAETSEDESVELHLSSVAASRALSEPTAPQTPCFQFLHHVERSQLADLLAAEHPRTVAIVASHLSEDCAASLLGALLPASRAEVVRRFSEAAVTDPLVLSEIEQSLRARLSAQHSAARHTPGDLLRISRVLSAVDVEEKQQSLLPCDPPQAPTLLARAPDASPESDPLAMTFVDLEYLDEELLTATLRRCDPEIVRLALAGATAAFVEKVLNRLSLSEARRLRRQIESIGPTRLSDMERAQVELARLAEVVLIEALQGPDLPVDSAALQANDVLGSSPT
jgi:flagellar motor switch protein FliG